MQIADLRDSLGILSEILCETRSTYDDLLKTMETVSTDTMISSTHGDVLKDLHDKLTERRQVFMKRSIELARKQAWYRSVALGPHRRGLLCWMLGSIFQTLKVNMISGFSLSLSSIHIRKREENFNVKINFCCTGCIRRGRFVCFRTRILYQYFTNFTRHRNGFQLPRSHPTK